MADSARTAVRHSSNVYGSETETNTYGCSGSTLQVIGIPVHDTALELHAAFFESALTNGVTRSDTASAVTFLCQQSLKPHNSSISPAACEAVGGTVMMRVLSS